MKRLFNRYSIIFLALTAYLIVYRALWKAGLPDFHAAVVGCALVYAVARLTRSELALKNTGEKMTPLVFFTLLGITFLGQALMVPLTNLMEATCNAAGLSMYTAPEAVQSRELFTDSFSMLTTGLWPILLGPAVEELLYRSYACRNFGDEGGMNLAILLSALAFAAGHGRFYLTVNTFISALATGYILFRYGLKWCIIFHVINNLGIVGSNLLLCVIFGDKTGNLLSGVVAVLFALFALAVIYFKRAEVKAFVADHRAPKGEWARAFLNPGFFVFIGYDLYKCLASLAPM